MQLMKKREREREQLEQLKQKIAEVFFKMLCESHGFPKTILRVLSLMVLLVSRYMGNICWRSEMFSISSNTSHGGSAL